MARPRIPLEMSRGRPAGPRWSAYTRVLKFRWFAAGRTCWYCAHPFRDAGLIEACHLISPQLAPQLAWDASNLVPGHGATKRGADRRCPDPGCQLNCNWAAHNSPLCHANKNSAGEDMPFTPEILAALQADRRVFLAAKRAIPRDTPADSGQVPRKLVIPFRPDAGRDW